MWYDEVKRHTGWNPETSETLLARLLDVAARDMSINPRRWIADLALTDLFGDDWVGRVNQGALDALVHDLGGELACAMLNTGIDASEDDVIGRYETWAAEVNNQGPAAQVDVLLNHGVGFGSILGAIGRPS